ncbi:MAG: OmpH family outer membrane protein, partial [Pyrinomonadaceae bacterium]
MKIDRLIAAVAFLAAIAVSPILAQTRPAATPATPPQTSAAAVPESKIALIYSSEFQDPKTGIARFVALMTTLNREFQPRQTEIQQLAQKMQQLNDEIEKTKSVADPRTLQTKVDQLEQMNKDLTRKREDGQAAYDKRQREILSPLQADIGKALEGFAKQRGINVIIDGSQVPLLYA